jgi:dCMP deaminase
MNYNRPTKKEYYLGIAKEVARRGTCLRRNFGAVIVNNDQIVSTGYTGAPRGMKNCMDLNYCIREAKNIPRGQRYELCRSVHAEMNAIIHAARAEMSGGMLFLVGLTAMEGTIVIDAEPCKMCKKAIINAGIKEVYILGSNNEIKEVNVSNWIDKEEDFFILDTNSY